MHLKLASHASTIGKQKAVLAAKEAPETIASFNLIYRDVVHAGQDMLQSLPEG